MPSSKKRRGSNDYRDDESACKKLKKIPSYNPQEICQDLYEIVRNQKTEDGRLLCEPFIRAPKRRNEPDYYVAVNTPMDLLKIQHRLKSEEYDDVEEMANDFELMINNAKSFYQVSSMEYKQALELWDLFQRSKAQLISQALGECVADRREVTETDEEASINTTMSEIIQNKKQIQQPTPLKVPVLKLKVVPNSGESTAIGMETRIEQVTEESNSCLSNVVSSGSDGEEEVKPIQTSMPKRKRRTRKAILEAMMASDEPTTSTHVEDDDVLIEQLFSATVTASDDSRCLTDMFRILPSKTRFPEYYQVIKEPMDLRLIARKIQSSSYSNVDSLLRDIFLVINNAKTFNEPGSQIYKDATSLRKFVLNKKQELEQMRQVRSQRTRGRSLAQQQNNLSAVFAALKSESDEEASSTFHDHHHRGSDGDMSDDENENEQWFLFNAVKNYKDCNDQVLCEPFLRLPSRRFYPDYYLEIKRPMSIMKIQKKIKSGSYQDLEGVANDFNLVFNNAKQYNREDSRIYQDADTLQKVMQNKYMELIRNRDGILDSMDQKGDIDSEEIRKKSTSDTLRRNLYMLFRTLFEFKVGERHVIDLFVNLPSKKDYPDYYQVISQPIDMNTIDQKIKSNKYNSVQSLASDLELMFRNARHYNEETSQVYKDAEMLEKLMHNKVQQLVQTEQATRCLSPTGSVGMSTGVGSPCVIQDKMGSKSGSSTKLQDLFNRVKDFVDNKGRVLSTPFMKLPHKNDYPDYYEVISRPMDLLKIQQKLQSNASYSIDEMFSDLTLVFNNACIYNEPDSQIYKDAVTLLRVCSEGRIELNEESLKQVLHVPTIVLRILNNLIQLTISYSDKEGRCYSNTFCELMANDSMTRTYLTFEEISQRVEQGAYKRLDCLQEDVFKLCEHARNQSSINSQLYEDAVEVQDFFIRKRDELCRQGDILHSPALQYTLDQLYDSVVREKRDKMAVDSLVGNSCVDDDEKGEDNEIAEEPCMTYEYDGQLYTRGDFVYVQPRDEGLLPPIMGIEKILTQEGQIYFRGCWFLRHNETFHRPERKFIDKEVFKSEFYETLPFTKVIGRCLVTNIQHFMEYQPVEIPPGDVYICESRYSTKNKTFKKIKKWLIPLGPNVRVVKRDVPMVPLRKCLVLPALKSSLVADVVEKQRVPVALESMPNGEPGATYYEQMRGPNCWIRIGDCVAVKNTSTSDHQTVIRVDRLWTASNGEAMLSGMLFLYPSEVEANGGTGTSRLYYRKELLLSNREEIRSCSDVTHVCSVLSSRDYCLCRYTQVDENNVYICDYKYNEMDRAFKKFNKPLKHPCLSSSVCEDEILYFKKAIVIIKEPIANIQVNKTSEVKIIEEESMDFCSSVGDQSLNESSSFIGDSLTGAGDLTPNNIKKRKKRTTKVRNITGYIVYAGECRKDIQAEFPDLNFGDISRAVGTRWKNLPKELKEKYEEKARILLADASLKANESQFSSAVPSPGAESRSMSPNSSIVPSANKTSAAPVPSSDVSIQQNANQMPQIAPAPQQLSSSNFAYQVPHQTSIQVNGTPLFVGVPPQTQRIVHSDAYLRYIHGLARGTKRIGDFDKSFSAKKPDNASMEASKLPSHWLGGGPGHHGDVVSALWAMREHMLRDAINIHNILY